jgi:hypothetical protein
MVFFSTTLKKRTRNQKFLDEGDLLCEWCFMSFPLVILVRFIISVSNLILLITVSSLLVLCSKLEALRFGMNMRIKL